MDKKNKKNDKLENDVVGDFKGFHDSVVKSNGFMKLLTGLDKVRVATAMVYERVGDTEYFLGGYPLLRGKFHQIGEYYVLSVPGKPYFFDCLGSDVFTPAKDAKIGKIVEIVKYTNDDYRVRRKLDKSFYLKEKKLVYGEELVALTDENSEVVVNEDTGDPIMVKMPLRDEFGKLIYSEVVTEYSEPKGVTQEGRDAIRIHNQTNEEIKKFKEMNEGFWSKFSKHGGMTVIGLALITILFLFGMKMQTDSWTHGVDALSDEIKDVNSNLKWWQQADALDTISSAVAQKTDEKEAPPVK